MKKNLNRREVLESVLALGTMAMIPANFVSIKDPIEDQQKSLHLAAKSQFLVKHGHYSKDNKFLWSIMTVANENKVTVDIKAILNKFKYYTQLKYSSNDRYKIMPSKQIIDYILSPSSGITFKMTLFDNVPDQFLNLSPSKLNLKKSKLYEKIIDKNINSKIIEKLEDRFGPSSAYNDKFLQIHKKEHEAVNANSELLIQVNDLISGICFSILTSKSIKSTTKTELNNYFNLKALLSNYINQNNITIKNINIIKTKVD